MATTAAAALLRSGSWRWLAAHHHNHHHRAARTTGPRGRASGRRRYSGAGSAGSTGAGQWEATVGIEIHAQISAATKAFSAAPVAFAARPNSKVAFWDAALPGTLPVLNARCVEAGVMTALALGANVSRASTFDRKHYFYHDLPSGYQITQQSAPLAVDGRLRIGYSAESRAVGIDRLHLEHDSGKSMHSETGDTLVDLNRTGCGLMEIVTRPELRSGEEAAGFVKQAVFLLRALGTCDGNMQEGSLRVDANVSVARCGSGELGTRCEVKNISGLRFLQRAVDYEIGRQIHTLEAGGTLTPQTLTFNAATGETHALRSKEGAVDYRFTPDPDLPPLVLSTQEIDRLQAMLPELPQATVARLTTEDGLHTETAVKIVEMPGGVDFYTECTAAAPNGMPKPQVANWLTNEVYALIGAAGDMRAPPVSVEQLVDLLQCLATGQISRRVAQEVLVTAAERQELPSALVAGANLGQLSDESEIARIAAELLAAHPKEVAAYAQGQHGKLGFFVGQLMRETGGRADPKLASRVLRELLSSSA